MKSATGGLQLCCGHAAIPGCTSGSWRRKQECEAEQKNPAAVRHFQTHQPRVTSCSGTENGAASRTGSTSVSLEGGGRSQGLHARGVGQMVRMNKIRFCPSDGCWGAVRQGLVNQK